MIWTEVQIMSSKFLKSKTHTCVHVYTTHVYIWHGNSHGWGTWLGNALHRPGSAKHRLFMGGTGKFLNSLFSNDENIFFAKNKNRQSLPLELSIWKFTRGVQRADMPIWWQEIISLCSKSGFNGDNMPVIMDYGDYSVTLIVSNFSLRSPQHIQNVGSNL